MKGRHYKKKPRQVRTHLAGKGEITESTTTQ